MLKILPSLLLVNSLLISQSLSSSLTQRGGEHNALFLNPTYLIQAKIIKEKINGNILNSSIIIDNKSLNFIKELNSADNNQEISKLLKKNIGKQLSLSVNNFSSLYQIKENIAYSLGVAYTLDGYFITHSGFGSKRALETAIEKNQAVVGTAVLKHKQLEYGINLKLINRSQTIYNYSIAEMLTQESLWDYIDNSHTQKESAVALDFGISYNLPRNSWNTKLSLALLNVGDTSFQELGTTEQSTTLGLSLDPHNTHIKIDYFDNSLRADISKSFFNKSIELHSGVIHNALSLGLNYNFSIFTIGLFSYKTEGYHQKEERKNELSLVTKW
jgi:hypothetical protein